jgi:choloylglycine hydrolase
MNVTLPGFGCGDFQLKAQDGTIMCGRSMEFPIPQNSQIVTFNRGERFESKAPDGTKGLEWTSKYGFTGINAFHIDAPDEGLNEAGLSFGVLTLDETQYQTVDENQKDHALAIMDVSKWILGNFATVAEVKEAIPTVCIWGQFIKPLNKIPGLHIALHDADGNNGVIEFINGEIIFYDNPIGVLTNDPPLPWHLQNLQQYVHLTQDALGNETKDIEKGMLGLPGDWSAVSRFVRIWVMSRCANPKNEVEAFNDCTHILNATDIPNGAVIVEIANQRFKASTLWSTIKDLKNRIFYFRSHGDMTFRSVCLNDIPLKPGTIHPRLPVQAEKPTIIDISKQLYNANFWSLRWFE